MSKKLLIVVDMQKDFVTGPLGSSEAVEIVPYVSRKIDEYLLNGDRVIFTYDTHTDKYLETAEGKHLPVVHCVEGSDGWCLCPELLRDDCEAVVKDTFGYQDWKRRGVLTHDRIELIGVCTDVCVVANALILKTLYPETEVVVDASCCAGTTPEKHRAALEVMKSCQINVINE